MTCIHDFYERTLQPTLCLSPPSFPRFFLFFCFAFYRCLFHHGNKVHSLQSNKKRNNKSMGVMLKKVGYHLSHLPSLSNLLTSTSFRYRRCLILKGTNLHHYSSHDSNDTCQKSLDGKRGDRSSKKKRMQWRREKSASHRPYETGFRTPLPQSLDRSEKEKLIDVVKYFPSALHHLRSSPKVPEVEEDRLKHKWHDEVHYLNVDGVQTKYTKDSEGIEKSFFDQRSLDIRRTAEGSLERQGSGLMTHKERLFPDVLRITGGTAHEHGLALSENSNEAPADPTVDDDGDFGEGRYGDTPVELTHMLKERMIELKKQKLREDHYTSYVPKRLNLASDEEVALANAKRKELLRKKQNSKKLIGTTAPTTLADIVTEKSIRDESSETMGSHLKSSSLEGVVSDDACLNAKEFLQHVSSTVPGLSSRSLRRSRMQNRRSEGMDGVRDAHDGVALLRTLPRAGFCSRREAELIISSGQVRVNNVVERNAFRIVQAKDDIHVAGHQSRLRFAPPRLWLYHKPAHVIVSRHDVAGRALITKHATILGMDHLIPVGSLPMRAHGALLLTNDGELSRFLEDPRSMIQQTYLLRVRPSINPLLAHKLNTKGMYINGKHIQGVEFMVNPSLKSRFSVKVKTKGDASLPIYELLRHLGRTIERGGRIAIGPFSLGHLAVGSICEVTVPPHYIEHAGRVWKPFVERDWPYYRRRRILKLRKISHYRELTPKEVNELENAAYTEIQESMKLEASELDAAVPETAIPLRPIVDFPLSSPSLRWGAPKTTDQEGVDTLDNTFSAPEVLADITDMGLSSA